MHLLKAKLISTNWVTHCVPRTVVCHELALQLFFCKPEMFQSLIDGYLATRMKACSSECSQCLKYVSWLLKYIDIDG